jgi:hypothetical protein
VPRIGVTPSPRRPSWSLEVELTGASWTRSTAVVRVAFEVSTTTKSSKARAAGFSARIAKRIASRAPVPSSSNHRSPVAAS